MSDASAIDRHEESLLQGDATWAVVVEGVSVMASVDDELWRIDRSASWVRGATSDIRGAAELGDDLLLLTEDGLVSVSDQVSTSPLDGQLAAVSLDGTSDAAVLQDEDGFFGWQNGQLRALDTRGTRRGLGAGGGMIWLAAGGRVHGIEVATWDEVDRVKARPDLLRVDDTGAAWLAAGDTLERGADAWVFPGDIERLATCAGAWVEADGRLWRVTADEVLVAEGAGLVDCDALGRAVVATDSGVARVSDGRPIGIIGVDAVIEGDTAYELVVSGDDVDSALVAIDGLEQDLVDRVGVIDALKWFDGADHLLEAEVVYADGAVETASLSFRVEGIEDVGFEAGVEPIYDAACSTCHADGTETELAGYDAWVQEFDLIVTMIESDAMPLGRDPLTGSEKATIKAWGEGGFAP